MIFVISDFAECATLVLNCDDAERLWCVIHTDHGPFAVCAWYRPPEYGEVATIASFKDEWREQQRSAIGTIAVGDMNVHSQHWLRLSSGESPEGAALAQVCRDIGARQVVREPTRESYLLDLVLTDIDDLKAKVVPGISDRDIVITSLKLSLPERNICQRAVWQFRDAVWDQLRDSLYEEDWSSIDATDTNMAAQQMTDTILKLTRVSIPERTIEEKEEVPPLNN